MNRLRRAIITAIIALIGIPIVSGAPMLTAQAATLSPAPLLFYTFGNTQSTDKCLNVSGGVVDNGAPVIMWDCIRTAGTTNEQWQLYSAGSGRYQIKAVHSGKCLDVDNSSTITSGSIVQQWTCLGTGTSNFNQLWIPERVHIVPFTFVRFRLAADNNLCLLRSTSVTVNSCNNTAVFAISLAAGSIVQIKSRYSAKCLDVASGSFTVPKIRMWTCLGTSNQLFKVTASGRENRFVAQHNQSCMAGSKTSTDPGLGIYALTCATGNEISDGQVFGVIHADADFLSIDRIRFGDSYVCVDLDTFGGGTGDGTNVQQWWCNFQTNQQWRISRVQ